MSMKRLFRLCVATLALLTLLCAPALAKVASPGPDFYYLDQANVLSEETKGEIFFSNQLLQEACGAQMVVVTVKSTGSQAIDDYTYELANSWGVGDSAKDNGFVLLLAIDDDDYYAICGTGLQSKFSSGTLKSYYDQYLETDFAAKRYDAGVKKFFEAAFKRVADTYNANVTTAQGIAAYQAWVAEGESAPMVGVSGGGYGGGQTTDWDARNSREESDNNMIVLIVFLFMLIILMKVARFSRRRRATYGGSGIFPIFINTRRTPPPPPPGHMPGPGGVRGGAPSGGYRSSSGWGSLGGSYRSSSSSGSSSGFGGLFGSGSSRSFGSSSRSSGSRSFGSSRGGGGSFRGGGAGRGRH